MNVNEVGQGVCMSVTLLDFNLEDALHLVTTFFQMQKYIQLVRSDGFYWISFFLIPTAHCSKSSFFVQKFNFDFPRKLSKKFGVKNS